MQLLQAARAATARMKQREAGDPTRLCSACPPGLAGLVQTRRPTLVRFATEYILRCSSVLQLPESRRSQVLDTPGFTKIAGFTTILVWRTV